ncbi:MAG: serine hydrolase [Lachnospiraceae bacterium]
MDMHHMMVLKNGKVISECSFAPYPKGMWHITHSLCKSITGMAIGMLIEEGKLSLEDRVIDIFGKRKNILGAIRQRDVTVKHLLNMTSNVSFNEAGIIWGNEWTKGFLESAVHDTPGTGFEYNSMNSYMLSAIVTELTGQSMMEYLEPRLWEPLGITKVFWETSPRKITKGGWGLFLCAEDAAKLGQLYLQKGNWKGEQILPEEWVEASVTKQSEGLLEQGGNSYGYQIWMGKREGSFNYNGMLGQNILVYPDLQMVLMTYAGNHEFFQNGRMREIIETYFERDLKPSAQLDENPYAYSKLRALERKLSMGDMQRPCIQQGGWRTGKKGKRSFFRRNDRIDLSELDGNSYQMTQQKAGIFPLLMQVFHNNFADGIARIDFEYQEGRLWMRFGEGDQEHRFCVGFSEAVVTEIVEHGEPYCIAVQGKAALDEDKCIVLKIKIAFLEEASRRLLKIHFSKDLKEMEVYWDETPGKQVIMSGLDMVTAQEKSNFIMNGLKEKGGMELIQIVADDIIRPVTHGVLVTESTQEPSVTES